MTTATTFSPLRFLCYVDDDPVTQPGEGEWSVEPTADDVSEKEGLYGDVMLSINPSKLFTVTLRLQASSPDNLRFTRYAQAMKRNGQGFFRIRFVDINDTAAKFTSERAWVRKVPKLGRTKDAGDTEWIIGAGDGELIHQGTAVITIPTANI